MTLGALRPFTKPYVTTRLIGDLSADRRIIPVSIRIYQPSIVLDTPIDRKLDKICAPATFASACSTSHLQESGRRTRSRVPGILERSTAVPRTKLCRPCTEEDNRRGAEGTSGANES